MSLKNETLLWGFLRALQMEAAHDETQGILDQKAPTEGEHTHERVETGKTGSEESARLTKLKRPELEQPDGI